MFDFLKQERVSGLLHEAVMRIPHLASNYNIDLSHEFRQVQSLLDSTPVAHGQKTLLLGLARQHITRAERFAVKQIIANGSIGVDEMSHLVRIRLICAELLNLFAQSLAEFRGANQPVA